MKERPIAMHVRSVQGILSGRKTQTRRSIRPQLPDADCDALCKGDHWVMLGGDSFVSVRCPFGQPGDRLWVREKHRFEKLSNFNGPDGGPGSGVRVEAAAGGRWSSINYDEPDWCDVAKHERWRSSTQMPKWACRLWLTVKDVRVEQVQEISTKDAMAEGCVGVRCRCIAKQPGWGCTDCMGTSWEEPPQVEYHHAWDEIHAKRGFGWDANPWVWVVEFEVDK